MLPLLALALLAADPYEEALLKTFREEFVLLTPGEGKFPKSFERGRAKGGGEEERPVGKVTFGYSFAVAKYEVPQNLWGAVMGDNPSKWKGKRNSVEMLSYDDAVAFCQKATAKMRELKLIDADQVIRLPSEAEWEYAARAGTTTVYSFGDDAGDEGAMLKQYAWYTGNAAGNDPPVGAKKPNAWGLYDMHGYLWEFCSDVWFATHEGSPIDGTPRLIVAAADPKTAKYVARSGSWKDPADRLTSSARRGFARDATDDALGLRCVLAKEKK